MPWHRRAGKDDVCLRWMSTQMVQKAATYWFMLPEAAQARKAIWDAVNPHTGKKRVDEAFPEAILAQKRNTDMYLETKNGSTLQIVGSDNFNSLVGSPPYGLVFSEYALCDPMSWAILRPILLENGGWAIFNSTSRGNNHFKALVDFASANDNWHCDIQSADKTGVFTPEQLEAERQEYHSQFGLDLGEALFNQEYLCSFAGAVVGAYYGRAMDKAERDGRVCKVPVDPRAPVITAWDLGNGGNLAIWFVQVVGVEIRVIDFQRAPGDDVAEWMKTLDSRGYRYGEALLPHDAEPKRLGTGKSIKESLEAQGMKCRVVDKLAVQDGINAVRNLIPRCWFDRERCAYGLDALRSYHAEYDESRKVLSLQPYHDWSSHPADAFRYLAVGLNERRAVQKIQYPRMANVA